MEATLCKTGRFAWYIKLQKQYILDRNGVYTYADKERHRSSCKHLTRKGALNTLRCYRSNNKPDAEPAIAMIEVEEINT